MRYRGVRAGLIGFAALTVAVGLTGVAKAATKSSAPRNVFTHNALGETPMLSALLRFAVAQRLLMVMAGLERPDSGSVVVADQALGTLDEDALARFRGRNVGIVFQSFHLIPTMTALENVSVPLELAGVADAADRAISILGAVGLGHRLTHLPGQLSGGEQQRVALARAFVSEPLLLLADEPTGNLDEETGAEIIKLLRSLNRDEGLTIVMVTHNLDLVAATDRVVRIAAGRIDAPPPAPIVSLFSEAC